MSCPHYEGNGRCAAYDPSSKIARSDTGLQSSCSTRGLDYLSCKRFIRATDSKREMLKRLEQIALEKANSL